MQNKRIFYSFIRAKLGVVDLNMIDDKIFIKLVAEFFWQVAHFSE